MTEQTNMRLNVHLDEELLVRAMAATGLRTRKATIEEALRLLIQRREWAVAPNQIPQPDPDAPKPRGRPRTKT